jgi:hypothetical protein
MNRLEKRYALWQARKLTSIRNELAISPSRPFGAVTRTRKFARESSVAVALAGILESHLQPDSAVKAVESLERSCPTISMAPVLAITWMVASIVLAKGNGPTPMERV